LFRDRAAQRKPRNARASIADVAGRQHGVVTTTQLLAAGLSHPAITRRVADARDVTSHRRMPVTTMHRTHVDLADVLTAHQLANVMHDAAFRGRLVVPAIHDAMARVRGRPRLWVVERALELYAGRRSGAEDAFVALVDDLAEPLVDVEFEGFERDFHWPASRLVVEIDGPGHGRPRSRLDDVRRDRSLREAGYTVLRFSDHDVHQRPRELLSAVSGVVGR
jgi:hypothetical protein